SARLALGPVAPRPLRLFDVERIRLVEAILHSLDKPDHDIEQSRAAESEARYQAHKRGELDAIDWEEIRKRYGR
ncbi:MAG: addiction module protein, partial [Syntrophobacteraceae bacterium]